MADAARFPNKVPQEDELYDDDVPAPAAVHYAPIRGVDVSPQWQAAPSAEVICKFCAKCGTPRAAGKKFCAGCGALQ